MKKQILLFLTVFTYSLLAQWTAVNNGLGSLKIRGLAAVGSSLVAVTVDQGLFVSTNFGESWQPHPQNNSLPNFDILFAQGDPFFYIGVTILGQGYFASVDETNILILPIQGIPDNNLSAWIAEQGSGISDSEIIGTAGGGLFWATDLSSTSWTEITGLPDPNSKYITGLGIFQDPVTDDEYLLAGTRNGVYISSSPNSIASVSPNNQGLTGDALYVNKFLGQIALTKNGVYLFPDETGLSNGWEAMIPSGDFRDFAIDMITQGFYFFGNQVGKVVFGDNIYDVDLTGITGGIITTTFVYYPNQTPPGYIFVGTENGGVFRQQLSATDVDDNSNIVSEFKLNQNYPNPFNPGTRISWQVPAGSHQTLKVYDILGNEVATLVDEYRDEGSYEVEFNAGQTPGLSSGVYFYKLQAGNYVQVKKMILMK